MIITDLDDKTDVLRALQEATAQCDTIAEVLGVHSSKIEVIKSNHLDCEDRLRDYVDEWLKGNARAERTWTSLCDVLKDPLVGRRDVGDTLEDELPATPNHHSMFTS